MNMVDLDIVYENETGKWLVESVSQFGERKAFMRLDTKKEAERRVTALCDHIPSIYRKGKTVSKPVFGGK